MWMKIFLMPQDINHQINYIAAFNDLTIVDEFSAFTPMHGWFLFDLFQEVFGFPSVFYGNRSDDFIVLDSVGFFQ